jgi:hypothetical protein
MRPRFDDEPSKRLYVVPIESVFRLGREDFLHNACTKSTARAWMHSPDEVLYIGRRLQCRVQSVLNILRH